MNHKTLRWILCIVSIIILGAGLFLPSSELWLVLIGLLTFIALILLNHFTHRIAGLSKDNPKVKTMKRLNYFTMALILFFFGVVQWVPAVRAYILEEEELFGTVLAAVLMIVIGNAAPKLPFNRYIGLRLPWTVRDEMTWRVAHKLLGYLTFPIVIVMVAGCILGQPEDFIKYSILAWVLIPGLYSGWYYYQHVSGKR